MDPGPSGVEEIPDFPFFGTIVFQKREELSERLDQRVLSELRNEVFPRLMPVNFRSREGFGGFKIFGFASRYVVLSYISDSRENDRWNRPLQRADFAMFDNTTFAERGREAMSLLSHLRACRESGMTPLEVSRTFRLNAGESRIHSTFCSNDYPHTAFDQLTPRLRTKFSKNRDFLPQILNAFSTCEKILVNGTEPSTISDIIGFLLQGLPYQRIMSLALTDLCTDPMNENGENCVFVMNKRSGTERRMIGKEEEQPPNQARTRLPVQIHRNLALIDLDLQKVEYP